MTTALLSRGISYRQERRMLSVILSE